MSYFSHVSCPRCGKVELLEITGYTFCGSEYTTCSNCGCRYNSIKHCISMELDRHYSSAKSEQPVINQFLLVNFSTEELEKELERRKA